MMGLLGIAVVFVMVFGGYIAAGGKMGIILTSLPFEIAIIAGAALGAYLIGNEGSVVKRTAGDIAKAFRGPKWKAVDYRDLLCLLFELIRLAKSDPVALEAHIEAPEESAIFERYPKIRNDPEAVGLIADTLRSASMNYDDPGQVEDMLENRMEENRVAALKTSNALRNTADGLPALGIVAAVLGVIKTMASIDQPPEVLGKLIGGALVGTFLGVFLAYGFVGPIATRIRTIQEEEASFYQLIREVLVANLQEHSAAICIEVGRQATPAHHRPSYNDLEDALKHARAA